MRTSSALRLLAVLMAGSALPACIIGGKKPAPPASLPSAPTSISTPTASSIPPVTVELPKPNPNAPENNLPSTIPPVKGKSSEAFSLRFMDITAGTGTEARPRACYYVHYTGWLSNGQKFDSTHDPAPNGAVKSPISFPQGAKRVITGWDFGFNGMRVGGKRRLFVPYQLGYGEAGSPPEIPARAALIFDVELMGVADPLPRPQTAAGRAGATPAPQCPTWETVRASN